jgi:hypothetical protein
MQTRAYELKYIRLLTLGALRGLVQTLVGDYVDALIQPAWLRIQSRQARRR